MISFNLTYWAAQSDKRLQKYSTFCKSMTSKNDLTANAICSLSTHELQTSLVIFMIYMLWTQYLYTIYTISMHYLRYIYAISTQYLRDIYAISTQYLLIIYWLHLKYLQYICYVHTTYALSAQYLCNIYTISTQYLHRVSKNNIYTILLIN